MTHILWAILYMYYSYKIFKIKPQINIFSHIKIAIISLLSSFALKRLIFKNIFQNQILILTVATFLSLAIFITIFFIFKELKREDIEFFFQLIKFLHYKNSSKEEFLENIQI